MRIFHVKKREAFSSHRDEITPVLLGAALVFFMQAGFAMVETGFTRAKNAGNIIMKNLMDFAIGTPIFWILGFGIMFGGAGALIGGG